jgi:hypothetical protein
MMETRNTDYVLERNLMGQHTYMMFVYNVIRLLIQKFLFIPLLSVSLDNLALDSFCMKKQMVSVYALM